MQSHWVPFIRLKLLPNSLRWFLINKKSNKRVIERHRINWAWFWDESYSLIRIKLSRYPIRTPLFEPGALKFPVQVSIRHAFHAREKKSSLRLCSQATKSNSSYIDVCPFLLLLNYCLWCALLDKQNYHFQQHNKIPSTEKFTINSSGQRHNCDVNGGAYRNRIRIIWVVISWNKLNSENNTYDDFVSVCDQFKVI